MDRETALMRKKHHKLHDKQGEKGKAQTGKENISIIDTKEF